APPPWPVALDRAGNRLPHGAVVRLGIPYGPRAEGWKLRFAPDGRTFRVVATGPALIEWDATTGGRVRATPVTGAGPHDKGARLWVSRDGAVAVVTGPDLALRVTDVASGRVRFTLPRWAELRYIADPLSPDGRQLAGFDLGYGSLTPQTIHVWD